MPTKLALGWAKIEGAPTWLVVLILIVVGIGTGVFLWWKDDTNIQLVSARQANERIKAEVIEYGQHIAEVPEATAILRKDVRGTLLIQAYADECSIISLTKNGKVRSRLILSLEREIEITRSLPKLFAEVFAASGEPRCLNPHPGGFNTWYGDRDGEWIQVWREWQMSKIHQGICKHVQMFNIVRQIWDSNADGTPRVTWTMCAH